MTSGDGSLEAAVSTYGRAVKSKLSAFAIHGAPEDQLRAPLEVLVRALASQCKIDSSKVTLVGETSLADLKTRPDFAVLHRGALVGFIEVKAPGKGADPRKFKNPHDRDQWKKLMALPNLIYTDGQAFSLWRDGKLIHRITELDGDIEEAGANLAPAPGLVQLFEEFFWWEPLIPRRPKQLAEMTARLCRLLRDEVTEELEQGSPPLTNLAKDWRRLLFPDASDQEFADGYAQTVTFGLLLARARGIDLSKGVDQAAKALGETHSLMGTALRVVTESVVKNKSLTTSNETLKRVLSVVDWPTVSKGDPDAWLYFYEQFLAEYDNDLRKRTGTYYTPAEVVSSMTRLADEALRSRFELTGGLAEPNVTILDPAVGAGTFLLAIVRAIATTIAADQGDAAVPASLVDSLHRIVAFEMQLGPFAVAQLRLLGELDDLGVEVDKLRPNALRTFVANTLDNPYVEDDNLGLGAIYEPIAQSRREANRIKRDEPVMVVIGNPPYKDKSQGKGGWIESGNPSAATLAPLAAFVPPSDWGVGAHVKHLYNPYVYFWRWATWKVFDQHPETDRGIVCFITVAGFLNGPGFQGMRAYLRKTADAVWVIDCTPEGHQPPVASRVFQAMQHEVCITIAVRDGSTGEDTPAAVKYRSLAAGSRQNKFAELAGISLEDNAWADCPGDWRAPFLPVSAAAWSSYPGLDDLFRWSGSGVMPGRTWIIAPDSETLVQRWDHFVTAPADKKPELLQEHKQDRTVHTVLKDALPGYEPRECSIGSETGECPSPVAICYRSFDRQYIIPDKRLINRPNPTLWAIRSEQQVYLTALTRTSPSSGPAVTLTGLVPDLDHYNGRGGRTYPLWLDAAASEPNVVPGLLEYLAARYTRVVTAPDLFAYVAAITANPAYTAAFAEDLRVPGLRIPLTDQSALFHEVVEIGQRVLWLQTYGQGFVDESARRPHKAPRLTVDPPKLQRAIPDNEDDMPDALTYNPTTRELHVGSGMGAGIVENVTPEMWSYEVSGVNVLGKWFSYRRRSRERPIIGDRRTSPLQKIQAERWLSEYTTDLLNLLHVLGLLVELEPDQSVLLDRIVEGPLVSTDMLSAVGVLPVPPEARKAQAILAKPTEFQGTFTF